MTRTATPRTRWTARRVAVSVTSFAVVAGMGIAAAAVFSSMNVKGSANRGVFVAEWSSAPDTLGAFVYNYDGTTLGAVVPQSPTLAAPTLTDGGKSITLATTPEVYLGETLYLGGKAATKAGTTKSGYVSGITTKPGAVVPAGWSIRLYTGCGAAVTAATPAGVSITATPTTETGPALDLTALGLAVVVTGGTAPGGLVCATIPVTP